MTPHDYVLITNRIKAAGIDLSKPIRKDPGTAALLIHATVIVLSEATASERQTFTMNNHGTLLLLDAARDGVEAVRGATRRQLDDMLDILEARPLSVMIRTSTGVKGSKKTTQIYFTVR